jgi:uncharacterized damage-inducible protein DinB
MIQNKRMHTHLSEVFERLDLQRAALRSAVDRIPPARRRERPASEKWSVTEVLEHLALVEKRFADWLGNAIAEARGRGLDAERDARAPLTPEVEALQRDRTKPRTAPPPVIPKGEMDEKAAWDALEQARAGFRATVTDADGLALSQVTVSHPTFGTLNVYQWVEFVAVHESRHTAQIEEIAGALR